MNWNQFNTYNESPNSAFETLCNQLFENWCKNEYKNNIKKFVVNNGSGGDGGVESYVILNDDSIIGLQAKWFPNCIDESQIKQITKSFETAIKIRPNINKYIVCIPRDLGNITGRSDNCEAKRWSNFVEKESMNYKDVKIELWNETKILSLLLENNNVGIYTFWFKKSEISYDSIRNSFIKSKNSWLSDKYVPDLDVRGNLFKSINDYVGDKEQREKQYNIFRKIVSCIEEMIDYISKIKKDLNFDESVIQILLLMENKLLELKLYYADIVMFLENESFVMPSNSNKPSSYMLGTLIKDIKDILPFSKYYFTIEKLNKLISKLNDYNADVLIDEITKFHQLKKSLAFIGEPGTGKTHGLASAIEYMLEKHLHIPILIQAREIDVNWNWKDIIISKLELSNEWSADEIWEALLSAANRNRIASCSNNVLPKVLIAVDGIDESMPYDKWFNRIKEANIISEKYDNIRFVFTSRPNAIKYNSDFVYVNRIGIYGDTSVYNLFDSYIKKYNITIDNDVFIKNSITTPLALKIFCELYSNSSYSFSNSVALTIAQLMKQKIKYMESEFVQRNNLATTDNQFVLKAIKTLAIMFSHSKEVQKEYLSNTLNSLLKNIDIDLLLNFLENYGIVYKVKKNGTGYFAEDSYLYYPGIQGYFDYVTALSLIDEYIHPNNIVFDNHEYLSMESLYMLAIISMQDFSCFITDNTSIDSIIDDTYWKIKLYLYSHRYISEFSNSNQYIKNITELMKSNAEYFIDVINDVILPLSYNSSNPFGVKLLDDFLLSFGVPTDRDKYISTPIHLYNTINNRWFKNEDIKLFSEEYILSINDVHNGRPLVYAWLLSSVDNEIRRKCRISLLKWGKENPYEFYKLFLKFNSVNDPQIRSDIYALLMSIIFEVSDEKFTRTAALWIMDNIFTSEMLAKNRDAAIRYYSRNIVLKAYYSHLLTKEQILMALEPHCIEIYDIELNKDALSGTRMGGYSAIDYDLSRYVLIDYFTSVFNDHKHDESSQLIKFVQQFSERNPDFSCISFDQFILSASYAFIRRCGWNEEDFLSFKKDNEIICGIDSAISSNFRSATHGSKSQVMTICEKYVWQSRNWLLGYLSDFLNYTDDSEFGKLNDYGLVEDFIVPSFENNDEMPKNSIEEANIPELNKIILDNNFKTFEEMVKCAKSAEKLDWNRWVSKDNDSSICINHSQKLVCLYGNWYFNNGSDIDTFIMMDTIIIPIDEFSAIINDFSKKAELISSLFADFDRINGYTATSCYISPQEICWSPWKDYYNGYVLDECGFENVLSAVERCTQYSLSKGCDEEFYLPSKYIREILNIVGTNNYLYYDENDDTVAIWNNSGEYDMIHSSNLWISDDIISKLENNNKKLIWLFKRYQRESGYSREKFSRSIDISEYYLGYYENGILKFVSVNNSTT